jgi:ABC-2 type transport system ATP-binding protein
VATGLIHSDAIVGVTLTEPGTIVIDTTKVSRFRHVVAAVAQTAGAQLYEVAPLDDDLESVFRYLVGR